MANVDSTRRSAYKGYHEGGLTVKKMAFLSEISFARSGDKGDACSIGLMAKTSKAYKTLIREVNRENIKKHFGGMVKGDVELYPMPNIAALHVVLRNALGGGATRNTRYDQTGKAMGQALLRMKVEVEEEELAEAQEATNKIFEKYGRAWEYGIKPGRNDKDKLPS
jgi:N-acetylglucosamine kinase-like BadF-type ATPase